MDDEKDASYYQKNRDARRAYQKKYYKLHSELIKRKRELETVLDPAKIVARKAYNRAYFEINRASIMEKRAARRKQVENQAKNEQTIKTRKGVS